MLVEIVKKEVRDQLLSLRLMLTFLLVIALMTANALLFTTDYRRRLADYNQDVNRNLAELARHSSASAPLFQAFSYNNQFLYRRPNPAGFVAEGHDKDLPNVFQVNAFRLDAPEYALRGNPWLWRFDSVDWAFIVGVILSFAAIVLVYDSISGEKELGTLRLTMAQPVSRGRILLGKYLGAMIVLGIPFSAGVVLNLLILAIGGAVHLDVRLVGRLGISFGLCLVYVSTFLLLGLLLSARSRESVTSLVTGLLVWVLLVVVIPASANLAARGLVKIPPQDRVLQEAGRAFSEAAANYNRRRPHADNWIMSGKWSPGEPLLRAFEANQAWSRVTGEYQDLLVAQVELARRIACVSPAGLLDRALQSVVDSGVPHYTRFLKSARRYRDDLGRHLEYRYPLEKAFPVDRGSTDRVIREMKLDFGAIPKFEDRFGTTKETVTASLWNAGALALVNLFLFAAAYFAFVRYDVR